MTKATIDELIDALTPLSALSIGHFSSRPDSWVIFASNETQVTVGDVRRARNVIVRAAKEKSA